MADRTITTTLRLEVGGFKKSAKEASAAVGGIGAEGEKQNKSFSASLAKNQASISAFGTAAGVAGLAVAAGVGFAVKRFADFDKAMSQVSATGGDARANIDALRDAAIELGAASQFSASEAAAGIEELLKAGVSAADVLGGGLKGALDLAAAGGIEVADAAEVAATALVQFRLKGEDVPHVADLLAAAAGKAQGSVDEMGQALKQSGLVASQMGLTIEETTGTLAAFASAGLIGSDAGTAFKTMLLRLANPSKEAATAMKDLGISAYDAQGNFVGIESVAGQLKERMAGLTQAQRDSALATIFGSDAIRAANVLYEQGADGIKKWTSDVDEAGYAAQVAAEKNNNLAGDLERLQGTIDSALNKSGGGANEALRELVQGLDDLVGVVARLKKEDLQAGLAVVATTAGSLLAVAAVSKLAVGVSTAIRSVAAMRAAMESLSASSPKAAAGLSKVGKAAAGAGIALAAGAALGAGIQEAFGPKLKPTEDYANALVALGKGGAGAADSLNQLLDAGVISESGEQVRDLSSAFKNLASQDNPVNNFISGLGDAMGGLKSSQRQVQDQFKQLDSALVSLDGAAAGKAFREIAREAEKAGTSNEALLNTFPEYKAKLSDLANSLGVTNLSAEEYVKWMGGEIPPAVKEAASANSEMAQKLNDVSGAGVTAAQTLDELRDAMEAEAQAALGASNAQIAYEQQLRETNEQLKSNKAGITGSSEAALKNRQALNDLASAALSNTEAMRKNGASAKDVAAAQSLAYDQFVKAARGAGVSEEAAARLAVEYGLIPKSVTTAIGAPGAKGTTDQVAALNRGLASVPPEKRAQIIGIYKDQGMNAALAALQAAQSKTVSLTVRTYVDSRGNQVVGKVGNKSVTLADGGMVGGSSPHPKADNIPAMLTAGEVVQSNAAGDYYGRSFLLALNSRRIPREAFSGMRFADGGQVPSIRASSVAPSSVSVAIPGRSVNVDAQIILPNVNKDAAAYAVAQKLRGLMG